MDRLNDREEKISDALYIQLKDILAIPVEIDTAFCTTKLVYSRQTFLALCQIGLIE